MGGRRPHLVGRSVADVAVYDDQCRPVGRVLESAERPIQPLEVVGVTDTLDVPTVRQETRRDVIAERDARGALDGDAVAVVDPTEIVELQMSRKRGRLAGDPLHHATVTAQSVGIVSEQVEPRSVVALAEPLGGHRHADAHRHALAERPRRAFHSGSPAILRMPRAATAQLPEALDVIERHGWLADHLVIGVHGPHACQMQSRIQQHRCMARRQYEAIAVGPDRLVRVKAQEVLPQRVHHRGDTHRRAGMTRVGLLNRIDAQRADGVDA